MNNRELFHELIFGALIGNIVFAFSGIKLLWGLWKQYNKHMYRHNILWLDYCKRNNVTPGKEYELNVL